MIKLLSTPILLFFFGCELPVNVGDYEEKYILFGNLDVFMATENTTISSIDTVYFSISSPVGSGSLSENLYISNAQITLKGQMGPDDSNQIREIIFQEDQNKPGHYYPDTEYTTDLELPVFLNGFYLNNDYRLYPGKTYTLNAVKDGDTLTAHTTIPDSIHFSSQEGEYLCEGELIPINADIQLNNFTSENLLNLSLGEELNGVDTLSLYTEECYVGSFASQPYFNLGFEAPNSSVIRTITFALEADSLALESDLAGIDLAEGEPFSDDLNCNGINDSVYANLFYNWPCDDSDFHLMDIFKIWKGHYYDSENRLYFENPFIWSVETTPIPMMWLYFNYYGLQLIQVQATDANYYNYLSGDPLGQNQQLLPDSNIENGYGLFSSTISRAFFIYTRRVAEN